MNNNEKTTDTTTSEQAQRDANTNVETKNNTPLKKRGRRGVMVCVPHETYREYIKDPRDRIKLQTGLTIDPGIVLTWALDKRTQNERIKSLTKAVPNVGS